jgi:glutaredoxin
VIFNYVFDRVLILSRCPQEDEGKEDFSMTKITLFLLAVVFLTAGMANADFYKWEDENGDIHITDYPPVKSGRKMQVYKSKSDSPAALPAEDQREANDIKARKEADIILFTKNACDDCDKAREFLKSRNVLFTEYNIETDQSAARKRKEIDDSSDVPFAVINKNRVYGFSESVYERTLKLKP